MQYLKHRQATEVTERTVFLLLWIHLVPWFLCFIFFFLFRGLPAFFRGFLFREFILFCGSLTKTLKPRNKMNSPNKRRSKQHTKKKILPLLPAPKWSYSADNYARRGEVKNFPADAVAPNIARVRSYETVRASHILCALGRVFWHIYCG